MTQLTPAQAFHEAQRLLRMGDYPRAGSLTQQLVQNLPDEPAIRGLHGAALARLGRLEAGLAMMRDALEKANEDRVRGFLAVESAQTLRRLGRAEEAIEFADRGIGIESSRSDASGAKAQALVDLGRYPEARSFVEACGEMECASLALAFGRACLLMLDPEAGIERVTTEAGRVGVAAVDLEDLLRVLGQLCERCGQEDKAFDAWRRAGRLRQAPFDAAGHRKTVGELIQRWNAKSLAKVAAPKGGGGRHVFLLGAPGSGLGLVESIIASHSKGFGCGGVNVLSGVCRKHLGSESSGFRRVIKNPAKMTGRQLHDAGRAYSEQVGKLAAEDAERIVDAQALNFYHGGVVPMMLPKARVVLVSRDGVEAGLASYAAVTSQPWAQDLDDLGSFTADAIRMCEHWKSLWNETGVSFCSIAYEDLVSDPEKTIRALLEFIGLEFEPACLAPHEHARVVGLLDDELRLPMSAQVHERAKTHAGRTKALVSALAAAV